MSDSTIPRLGTVSEPVRAVAKVIIGVLTVIAAATTAATAQFTDAPVWVSTITTWATWLAGVVSVAVGAHKTRAAVYPVLHVEQMLEDFFNDSDVKAIPEIDVPQVPGGADTSDPLAALTGDTATRHLATFDAEARRSLTAAAHKCGLL